MKDDEVDRETWQVGGFTKSRAHHYTENFEKKMVEVHVDMFLEYTFFCVPTLIVTSESASPLYQSQELVLVKMR